MMCAGCPVKTECLAEALDNEIEWGVWGGLTERERRALLRKRPNVTSWRELFETAMDAHEQGTIASVLREGVGGPLTPSGYDAVRKRLSALRACLTEDIASRRGPRRAHGLLPEIDAG